MHSFTDGTGRTWDITVAPGLRERVRSTLKIDLYEPLLPAEQPLWFRAKLDTDLLCRLLWAACQKQADARGVDWLAFLDLLEGDVLAAAEEAFRAEWAGFFRRRGHEFETVAAALEKIDVRIREGLQNNQPATAETTSSGP